MIELSFYRERIGNFYQVSSGIKMLSIYGPTCFYFDKIVIWKSFWLRILLTICLLISIDSHFKLISNNSCIIKIGPDSEKESCGSCWIFEKCHRSVWTSFGGNFFARYLNGNGRTNGIKVYHLNIRKLQNKVAENKTVVLPYLSGTNVPSG